MVLRTIPSPIRSVVLAALAACAASAEAWAQVEPETGVLAVPTARVAPAGTPSFVVGAVSWRSGGSWATRIPLALVLAAGSRLEIGARLDDSRPVGVGGGDTTSVRVAAKWQLVASDGGWRVALAGLGARRIGDDSTGPRYGAGLRVTREGFSAAWSAFADYGTGGLQAGAALEQQSGPAVLGLEFRGAEHGPAFGLLSVRRTLLGGISAWLAAGAQRRESRVEPVLAMALGVVPREAHFVPRVRAPAPAAEVARDAPEDLPDFEAAIAQRAAEGARARERLEFLRQQLVVPRPAPRTAAETWRWEPDSAAVAPSPDDLALLSAVARMSPCGLTVRAGRGPVRAVTLQRVRAIVRALVVLGADPTRITIVEGGPADLSVTAEPAPARGTGCAPAQH